MEQNTQKPYLNEQESYKNSNLVSLPIKEQNNAHRPNLKKNSVCSDIASWLSNGCKTNLDLSYPLNNQILDMSCVDKLTRNEIALLHLVMAVAYESNSDTATISKKDLSSYLDIRSDKLSGICDRLTEKVFVFNSSGLMSASKSFSSKLVESSSSSQYHFEFKISGMVADLLNSPVFYSHVSLVALKQAESVYAAGFVPVLGFFQTQSNIRSSKVIKIPMPAIDFMRNTFVARSAERLKASAVKKITDKALDDMSSVSHIGQVRLLDDLVDWKQKNILLTFEYTSPERDSSQIQLSDGLTKKWYFKDVSGYKLDAFTILKTLKDYGFDITQNIQDVVLGSWLVEIYQSELDDVMPSFQRVVSYAAEGGSWMLEDADDEVIHGAWRAYFDRVGELPSIKRPALKPISRPMLVASPVEVVEPAKPVEAVQTAKRLDYAVTAYDLVEMRDLERKKSVGGEVQFHLMDDDAMRKKNIQTILEMIGVPKNYNNQRTRNVTSYGSKFLENF